MLLKSFGWFITQESGAWKGRSAPEPPLTSGCCHFRHIPANPSTPDTGRSAAPRPFLPNGGRGVINTVYVDNLRARRFYDGYGFEAVGRYDFMVGTHADEDIIMRKML